MALDLPFRFLCIGLIYVYKFCISPLKPKSCNYLPTCSTYTLIAIRRFGSFVGCFMGLKRILRCNHKSKGGVDPVPDSIFGKMRFLI